MIDSVISKALEYFQIEVLPRLTEEIMPRIIDGAKEASKELFAQFTEIFSTSSDETKANIKIETFEMLNMERLVNIARNNLTPKANGVAAYMIEKNDIFYIYLANLNERELLPQDENKYVIIQSECVKKDILKLFGDDRLIIIR